MKIIIKLLITFILLINVTYSQISWQSNQINNYSGPIVSLKFINPNTGWVLKDGFILKSTNKGLNFFLQKTFSQTTPSMDFVNANTGFLNEGSNVWKTTDGGNSWSSQSITNNVFHNCIKFANSNTGYVMGSYSQELDIYKTTNCGVSWNTTSINNYLENQSVWVWSINFGYDINGNIDPNKIWICAYAQFPSRAILIYSTDGLNSFNTIEYSYDKFSCVSVIPGSDFISGVRFFGGNGIYNLNSYIPNLIFQTNAEAYGLQIGLTFTNQNNGYAVTRDGKVWKTTNQGYNWVTEYTFDIDPMQIYNSSVNFFNEIGYFGCLNISDSYGSLHTRTLGTTMKIYEDNSTVAGTIQFDGDSKNITSGGTLHYLRGGTSKLYIDPQSALTNKIFISGMMVI